MTITTQVGALRRAVQVALPVTEKRGVLPILQCLLLRGEGGSLAVEATNIDIHLATSCAAEGDLPPVCVPADAVAALLDDHPAAAPITLALEGADGTLRVTCGAFDVRLFTLPVEQFPAPSPPKEPRSIRLRAAALWRMIDRSIFAVSNDETRYYLNGIYVHRAEDALRAVATDGHRMMIAETPWPAGGETLPAGILPHVAASWLRANLCAQPSGAVVTLTFSDMRFIAQAPGWTLRGKLIDGTFPSYLSVMPQAEGAPLWITKPRELCRLLDRVSRLCRERITRIWLSRAADGALLMRHTSAERAVVAIAVPPEVARWDAEEAPEVIVQARYVAAFCQAMPAGLTMYVRGAGHPIRVEGDDGVGALMPMRA